MPGVVAAARAQAIDFVVVGPEAPLAAGMADALAEAGILAFGPTQARGPDRVVEVVRQADHARRRGAPRGRRSLR